jgi:hypothetical protein
MSQAWIPIRIELNTDIYGRLLAPFQLRAVQKTPASDSRMEDYDVEFYNSQTREAVLFDPESEDHRALYEHFLFIIHDFGREFLPRPYASRWNIAEDMA